VWQRVLKYIVRKLNINYIFILKHFYNLVISQRYLMSVKYITSPRIYSHKSCYFKRYEKKLPNYREKLILLQDLGKRKYICVSHSTCQRRFVLSDYAFCYKRAAVKGSKRGKISAVSSRSTTSSRRNTADSSSTLRGLVAETNLAASLALMTIPSVRACANA